MTLEFDQMHFGKYVPEWSWADSLDKFLIYVLRGDNSVSFSNAITLPSGAGWISD